MGEAGTALGAGTALVSGSVTVDLRQGYGQRQDPHVSLTADPTVTPEVALLLRQFAESLHGRQRKRRTGRDTLGSMAAPARAIVEGAHA